MRGREDEARTFLRSSPQFSLNLGRDGRKGSGALRFYSATCQSVTVPAIFALARERSIGDSCPAMESGVGALVNDHQIIGGHPNYLPQWMQIQFEPVFSLEL